jgi:putative ABC transport system substrate-binding protein
VKRLSRRQVVQGGLVLISLGLLSGCGVLPPQAQQPAKVHRVGFLLATSASVEAARIDAFQQGLRELGYQEGQNIVIEWRYAEGQFDRLPDLAAELVRLGVAVIVTGGSTSTAAAKGATATIPIVFCWDNDPVGNGLVASLARPGGNLTGLSRFSPELSGKRLQLLKEAVPSLSRVAALGTSTNNPGNAQALRETELAAAALAVQLQYLDVPGPREIQTAFREASKGGADGVVVLGSPVFQSHRAEVIELAATSRLPATYPQSGFVEEGGLMAYGESIPDLYRRAATYVDKILKGAKPADLPVEQSSEFELFINLTTATALGLTIPQTVLVQATEIIQ